jgi:hypothetical protein
MKSPLMPEEKHFKKIVLVKKADTATDDVLSS